jgi:hypothetical protein
MLGRLARYRAALGRNLGLLPTYDPETRTVRAGSSGSGTPAAGLPVGCISSRSSKSPNIASLTR